MQQPFHPAYCITVDNNQSRIWDASRRRNKKMSGFFYLLSPKAEVIPVRQLQQHVLWCWPIDAQNTLLHTTINIPKQKRSHVDAAHAASWNSEERFVVLWQKPDHTHHIHCFRPYTLLSYALFVYLLGPGSQFLAPPSDDIIQVLKDYDWLGNNV